MTDFSHNLAVVIGIDQYGNSLSSLQSAVNDVRVIANLLQQEHQYEVIALFDQQATLSDLQQLLTTTLPQKVQLDGRLLFYFAGHGIALNGEDGPQGYLIPQDAVAGNTRSYLAMSALHDALSELPCRHFLGILDCCFAGAFRWSNTRQIISFPQVIHQERYDRFIRDRAWQVLTSSAHDQSALDTFSLQGDRGCSAKIKGETSGQHSPFAATLIEALQGHADVYPPAQLSQPAGDGVITATELYLYLRDRVEVATEARHLRQTPGLHTLKQHDKGEFIFLRPNHPLNLPPAPPLDSAQNPYRGLQSFEAHHSDLFFGRSDLVKSLRQFVETHPLSIVLGASGTGKSSLVKAGLIPLLTQANNEQIHSAQWFVLPPIRPGENPFQSLNEALLEAELSEVVPSTSASNAQAKTLEESVANWVSTHPGMKLLIFIDQSEEIVTLCSNESVRQAFFQQILIAIDAHRDQLRVVLSLRSDFEPQVRDAGLSFVPKALESLGDEALKSRWQQGRFLVPAMTRAALREAIERPAEARVMYFQPHSLVDQLVEEVADMPGALPLLSFALSELYLKYLERQREARYRGQSLERALTQADYQSLGGVIQSLTRRADEEYETLISEHPIYAQAVRHVMLRLVTFNGGELARRRVRLSELVYPPESNSFSDQVIARFTRARLLVEGQDAAGNACVEAAHDALIKGWHKLQGWLGKEKNLSLQRRLSVSAVEWSHQRHPKFLWHNNPYLDVLKQDVLQSAHNNWLNQLETMFVQRSLNRRRRNSVIRWGLVSTALVLLSTISGLAIKYGVSFQNSSIASSSRLAKSMLADDEGLDAVRQAVEAGEQLLKMPRFFRDLKTTAEVTHALQETLYGNKERNRLIYSDAVESVAVSDACFNQDCRLSAAGLADGSIVLRSLEGSEVTQTLTHGTEAVSTVVFLNGGQTLLSLTRTQGIKLWQQQPNGRFNYEREIVLPEPVMAIAVDERTQRLATANRTSDTVTLWSLDGQALKTFGQGLHSDRINDLSFSPSGQRLATGSGDQTINIWEPDRDDPFVKTISTEQGITKVRFVDEQEIAFGSLDGSVSIWEIEDDSKTTLLGKHRDEVYHLATDPQRKALISASRDQTVMAWRLKERTLIDTFNGHRSAVTGVGFVEEDRIISVSTDESARLWQLNHHDRASTAAITGYVVDFSHNNQTIATADRNDLYFWRPDGTLRYQQLSAHSEIIISIRFSPKDNLIASADAAGTIKFWNLSGKLIKDFRGHQGSVTSLDFSPDGQMIASGSSDGEIKLWTAEGDWIDTWIVGEPVTSVAFSTDGKRVVSAGEDGTVRLWRLDGTHRSKDPISASILDVTFSPDGKRIASAGDDGKITLWDLNQASPLRTFVADEDSVQAVAFSPQGNILFSGGWDRAVKQWTLEGKLLNTMYEHDAGVVDIVLNRQGDTMASVASSTSLTPTVVVRKLALETLIDSSYRQLEDFSQTTQR